MTPANQHARVLGCGPRTLGAARRIRALATTTSVGAETVRAIIASLLSFVQSGSDGKPAGEGAPGVPLRARRGSKPVSSLGHPARIAFVAMPLAQAGDPGVHVSPTVSCGSGSLASELRCPSCEGDFPGGGSTAFPRPRRAGSTPELSGAAAFIRDEVAEEPQERNQVVADKTQADDD